MDSGEAAGAALGAGARSCHGGGILDCSGRTGLTAATGVVATDWSGATGPDPGVLGAATVPGHAAFAVAADMWYICIFFCRFRLVLPCL